MIAVGTAVLLVALSASALLETRDPEERAPGLAAGFQRIDTAYQQSTREFVEQTEQLGSADLATSLELYGIALQAAGQARAAVLALDTVPETRRPTDRLERALRVQELALEKAMTAARDRDPTGVAAASEQFQTGVLAYLAARRDMTAALEACAARCR